MIKKLSVSLSGKHMQLLRPSHGIHFFAGGFTEQYRSGGEVCTKKN